jgi:hypothetical protein
LKRNGNLGNSEWINIYIFARLELTDGQVPVIVVFTQYDKLLERIHRTLDESPLVGLSSSAVKEFIKNKADAELKEICIGPLEKFAGLDVPYAMVSSEYHYCGCL